ncbi:MAG: DJ-1/PfpI family protein [Planctomycetota bacterium]|nr:DJ-1/PfpI family protein [Planctomycetota bacterium]
MISITQRRGWLILAASLMILQCTVPSFAQAPDEDPYVCPPCGHDCLKTTFEEPGTCDECGMKFVRLSVVLNKQVDLHHDSDEGKNSPDEDLFVCPPCGHDCLKTMFEEPGSCDECGMKLVKLSVVLNKQADLHHDSDKAKKVAILLFDGVEIIDYAGPWEIFGAAGFDVFSVAVNTGKITTVFGMQVITDYTLENHPKPDIVLIPGGSVVETQNDPDVRKWLIEMAEQAEVVLSVCNGAYILAKAGLLDGLKATTTRPLVDGLANIGEDITVVHDVRYVDNGKIVTSGGLSAGMDAALHVVSRFIGIEKARNVANALEYDWQQE